MSEFDAVLRSLGLKRNGKTGIAALPLALTGQADFLGIWTGSLVKPHLTGTLKATQLAIEMPSAGGISSQPQFVRLDSVDVTGSYSPAQIAIEHAQLLRGVTRIALNGTLDASPGLGRPTASVRRWAGGPGSPTTGGSQNRGRRAGGPQPAFDGNSVIHARVEAANLDVADVQPFIVASSGRSLPVTGVFNARIQADGPLHAPAASGSVEMARGSIYGEPVTQLRIAGAMANQMLKLTAVGMRGAGGDISASGSYDLKARTFQVDAHSAGIDISRIEWVHRHNLDAAGKLEVSVTGSGTFDDPRLQAHATISTLTLGGQSFGAFDVSAHTANHTLIYNATTQLEGAELHLQGQTALSAAYATQAQLEFSRFNIGALLRMANIEAFSADSTLAGTVTIEGPLTDLRQLRGEAQLRQLAMTVAGVHLESEGGAHATLAGGRVRLDPLHVTGENTDLRAQGNLSLEGAQQLDLAASGSINLKLAETLDPDLTASGVTSFQVEAHGPLQHPDLQGRIDFQNGSLSLEDLPNGLSQLHGTLEFNQNRLEVKSLTAMTGGGLLSVGGYLAYQHGIFADLTVTGKDVHIRYPEGVELACRRQSASPGPAE